MRAPRLVQVLKDKADAMCGEVVNKIRTSEECNDLIVHVTDAEQKQCAREIYEDLTAWLGNDGDSLLEARYVELGSRRARQGVASSQLFWAIAIAQEHLWDYMQQECLHEDPVEFWGGVMLLRSLSGFFDRVVHFALIGHEKAAQVKSVPLDSLGRRRFA